MSAPLTPVDRAQFSIGNQALIKYVEWMIRYLERNSVRRLQESSPTEFNAMMETKCSALRAKNKPLYEHVLENHAAFEWPRLLDMLRVKEQIDAGQVSEQAASRQMGQQYFDEFVAPRVGVNATTGAGANATTGATAPAPPPK